MTSKSERLWVRIPPGQQKHFSCVSRFSEIPSKLIYSWFLISILLRFLCGISNIAFPRNAEIDPNLSLLVHKVEKLEHFKYRKIPVIRIAYFPKYFRKSDFFQKKIWPSSKRSEVFQKVATFSKKVQLFSKSLNLLIREDIFDYLKFLLSRQPSVSISPDDRRGVSL